MPDCLILGCGYLGQRVAAAWLAAGQRVLATTRTPQRADELRQLGVEPVLADVLDPDSLRTLPDAATVLFCVAVDRSSGHTLGDIHRTGLGNVLAELARPGRPAGCRFLYVSSTSVYGQCDGREVDETAATEPTEEGGKVMRAAELLLHERRPDALVLRFAGIYGPGRLIGARALQEGTPLVGTPDSWLNLIHVEDGAAAVLAAAERGRPGATYNVGDGSPVRRGGFYAHLAQLLGTQPPVFRPVQPDQPAPPHGQSNRRIVAQRMREELGVLPHYPSYIEGLAAAVSALRPPDSGPPGG